MEKHSKSQKTMRLFHYTVGTYLPNIIRDGKIKPATAWIDDGEKPAVWFTTNEDWEECCNKCWAEKDGPIRFLSKEETKIAGKGLIRIEVIPEAAPYTLEDFRLLSGISKKSYQSLRRLVRKTGANPEREWRVSFEPVEMDQWLSIEVWNGQEWCRMA